MIFFLQTSLPPEHKNIIIILSKNFLHCQWYNQLKYKKILKITNIFIFMVLQPWLHCFTYQTKLKNNSVFFKLKSISIILFKFNPWLSLYYIGKGSRKSHSISSSIYCLSLVFCNDKSENCRWSWFRNGTDFDLGILSTVTFDLFPDWLLTRCGLSDWLDWHSVLKNGWSSNNDLRYVMVRIGRPGDVFSIGKAPFT